MWILETICGPGTLAGEGDKSEMDSERKDIENENTESETKEYPEETSQMWGEVEMGKRKRSKKRRSIRNKRIHQESDLARLPEDDPIKNTSETFQEREGVETGIAPSSAVPLFIRRTRKC
ncbi:uncharacterized protein MONOS_10508 [Monocercomonoides exilis]|uniref:uncharacterized protein n=1 Tax=Monocercomonoides exilis TaxID=2049356 RepID=UPI00355A0FCB|nr:hypothetical protein MONOS_10508 [Monocercomonoides exilis]|eukprot:MONOS_10508.1-p1 / transcript=MONOS_10508.1 / gene=MONOS_10508 / organism=Monocercomonoides_exilis_PA203 / gene_product=unspecified product / transcript_product=unspecified product / location=Mono_scaffold00480:39423-39929(+) / protein_length=120 / sequence_SO=supercontig / SO=protein_coding / is_pseudo=false